MKILMATHYFPSHYGGVELVADKLFRGFSANGCEVTWLAADTTPEPAAADTSRAIGINCFNFVERKTGLPFPIPAIKALKMIKVEVNRAEIVILHDCLYLSNIAAYLLAKKRKTPILLIQHVGTIPYQNPVLRLLMKAANQIITRPMLRRANQVVFIGEETNRYFSNLKFKRPPELIFNGVDTELFRPAKTDSEKSELRRKFNLPNDQHVILFVGRFIENKGLPILKRLAEERPEWIWALAGRQGPIDPETWNAKNVRVFLAPPDNVLAELYRACDLFALPSRYEAFSLVAREAMASGVQVVCSPDVLKSDSAISDHIHVVTVESNNPKIITQEFLNTLDNCLASREDTDASLKRRDFAVSRYSWHHAIDQYLDIIARLTVSK